jgi:hypothetical protein
MLVSKIEVSPSHIAVLVPSVDKAAEQLQKFNFQIGEKEEFQETFEIYVHGEKRNSLLLMEAKSSGSYHEAFKKRGPGLHHVAIDVLDLNMFLESLTGSGWLLHLNSLKTIQDYKTAYLARPGFPAIIEVQQKKELSKSPLFIEALTAPLNAQHLKMVQAIGLSDMFLPQADGTICTKDHTIGLSDLF